MERLQREQGVRERLAPVQKLREEMNERKGGSGQDRPAPVPAAPAEEHPLNARLRNLRPKGSDTPKS
jgi:hypothetical protein